MTFRIGLSGALVPQLPDQFTESAVRRLAELDVTAVVTHLAAPPDVVAAHAGEQVRAALDGAGISVVQASAYNPNFVHPDEEVRARDLNRLRQAFAAGKALGAEMLITGCGSVHPTFHYGPSPENHSARTRARLVEGLRGAADMAEEAGLPLAMECHVLTALDTPRTIRDVLEEVDSPWIRANFDPVNLLGDLQSVYSSGARIREMWEVLSRHYVPCVHIKDVVALPELVVKLAEVPPGDGWLDFGAVFEVAAAMEPGAALIVEHLGPDRAPQALAWLRDRVAEADLVNASTR
jgi:sugar phosphate isomerase/epimerase